MFIDEVCIKAVAGKGGDGLVSWRREKCIPNGGPRGGDGGNGGNIFIQTTLNLNTLSNFRHKKVFSAKNGEKGGTQNMHGANGEDLVLLVPVGSIIKDNNTGKTIVDLDTNNSRYLLCRGGRGGYGNSHFVSSTRQAPSFAELGDIGEIKDIKIELKLVSDIGIIGIPSSGKSTLIGNITNVKPKIGDYPFTTLIPNLGVLEHKGKSLILEDVPGLIPGASEGKGLGIKFLKHIERTKTLLHLLDLYRLDNIFEDYENIRKELNLFSNDLENKEELVVLSKGDLLDKEMKGYIKKEFLKKYPNKKLFIISSATGEGITELKDYLIDNYTSSVNNSEEINFINQKEYKIIDLKESIDPKIVEVIYKDNYDFIAKGERLEQIVRMTDFSHKEAVMRVYDVLEKIGVIKKIEKELKNILKETDIDNSFFFEGNENSNFNPKVIIGNQEIVLDKLRYNL